jgi:hypothetical protein
VSQPTRLRGMVSICINLLYLNTRGPGIRNNVVLWLNFINGLLLLLLLFSKQHWLVFVQNVVFVVCDVEPESLYKL